MQTASRDRPVRNRRSTPRFDGAYVVGGADICDLFQPVVDRMVLSWTPGEYEGDAYFPEWDRNEWTVVDRTPYDDFTLEK